MTSYYTTLQKAKKIVGCQDDLEPRRYCIEPYRRSSEKIRPGSNSKDHSVGQSSATSSPRMRKDFSFCGSRKGGLPRVNSCDSSLKKKK